MLLKQTDNRLWTYYIRPSWNQGSIKINLWKKGRFCELSMRTDNGDVLTMNFIRSRLLLDPYVLMDTAHSLYIGKTMKHQQKTHISKYSKKDRYNKIKGGVTTTNILTCQCIKLQKMNYEIKLKTCTVLTCSIGWNKHKRLNNKVTL